MAQSAQGRYAQLALRREPFLVRAREFAALTLPSIQPPTGHNYSQHLPAPYMGLSSRAILHLSSKLASALMPPGGKLFRMSVPAKVLIASGADSLNADQERKLALLEDLIHGKIENSMWRSEINLAMQHAIVTGNVLIHMMPTGKLRLFRLDQFVVCRDSTGDMVELIIAEPVFGDVPDEVKAFLTPDEMHLGSNTLYTHAVLKGDDWTVYQEVNGNRIPGSMGKFKKGVFPFFHIRWSKLVREDYGRSKVEEHEADFRYGEVLTQAVGDGAAIASRALIMLKPNAAGGLNLRRRLKEARNGDVVVGNPEDADFKSFQSVQGFQFAAAELQTLKQDLSLAFLMNSAARRDAERVTAFELRQMIDEIEGTLGGVYSLLSAEMMYPLVRRLIVQMQASGDLPDMPDGLLEPTILTGLAALGREADVQRVAQALQMVQNAPPEAAAYIRFSELFQRALIGMGLADCVFSEQEVAQIKQQQAIMQAMQASAPQVAGAAADAALAGQAQGAQPPAGP